MLNFCIYIYGKENKKLNESNLCCKMRKLEKQLKFILKYFDYKSLNKCLLLNNNYFLKFIEIYYY